MVETQTEPSDDGTAAADSNESTVPSPATSTTAPYKMCCLSGKTLLSGGVPNASWDSIILYSQYNALQVRSLVQEKEHKNINKLSVSLRYEKFDHHFCSFLKDAKNSAISPIYLVKMELS
eukprot:4878926-Ditylum_brightwellii.AAC.1